ncbi:MAG: NADH-quinone oxidoreductase subunit J [Leptolinea sp.]|jgi:NADH-quinone oxidoreductase subunit J|nr:NADH-quinone oxidoreductase subunit J [Leptolinea sp.]
MTAVQVVFLITAAITLAAAVMVVSLRRMMQSALSLILALVGVAVVFAIIGNGFFAITQVVVYVGAIAILIVFSVMLTQNVMNAEQSQMNRGFIFAALGVALLFSGLTLVLSAWNSFQTLPPMPGSDLADIRLLGTGLTDPQGFALPFEAVSVLLLAALVGSIFIASERHKD